MQITKLSLKNANCLTNPSVPSYSHSPPPTPDPRGSPPYSGSEYGDPADLLPSGLSFALETQLADLDALTLLCLTPDPADPE